MYTGKNIDKGLIETDTEIQRDTERQIHKDIDTQWKIEKMTTKIEIEIIYEMF